MNLQKYQCSPRNFDDFLFYIYHMRIKYFNNFITEKRGVPNDIENMAECIYKAILDELIESNNEYNEYNITPEVKYYADKADIGEWRNFLDRLEIEFDFIEGDSRHLGQIEIEVNCIILAVGCHPDYISP